MCTRSWSSLFLRACACLLLACKSDSKAHRSAAPPLPWKTAAIAHGGVGSPPERSDGCRAAVDAALAAMKAGRDPLDAAVAGVRVLEADPRFNAGTGSRVRIDGHTVQMDAAVMDSAGRFGAVAVIENVAHPVDVARQVVDTPHLMIAGDGATRLARARGIPEYDPTTDEMRAKTAEIADKLRDGNSDIPASWRSFDWRDNWNFERSIEAAGLSPADVEAAGLSPADVEAAGLSPADVGSDTVAVAVRSADGVFAVAISTGGTAITLRGRVGDVPILGAGLYADEHGVVAATGSGEDIVRASLSRRVYDRMAMQRKPDMRQALDWGIQEIGRGRYIGLIAMDASTMDAAADRSMAWAARELDSDEWLGPEPGAEP